MNLNENRVREFAYQIWESEGKPHGQSIRHWEMACKLASESMNEDNANGQLATQAGVAPKKSRSKAPQAATNGAADKAPAKTPRAKKAKLLKDTLETDLPQI